MTDGQSNMTNQMVAFAILRTHLKNELYVTGSILVSLRAGDYSGNVVGMPAGNKASSPALRPNLSLTERVQDGKVGGGVNF